MSASLYYSARRTTPLTEAERTRVARVVADRHESFPCDDEESLYLYDRLDGGEVLAGSTKMPFDPGHLMPVVAHVLDSLTGLRRALPDAEWRVHLDDLDVEWDEEKGYELPGMRDPDLIAELGGL
ncbi:hypothetical protein [Saccharothrix yanglingensis]|uniref:Uncharacterized protein n=1 Tax=Saccharothrix yanglingensis TaxID=659496 RepID=A0ABU0X8N0_9PSEU|nr:hypothetical protein [Saccharothrix yanglingensis]MDQ2588063.1 hypothetical protein [Saccharothrix yanglingensis]